MDLLHPLCAGLDVHKDTVVACLRRAVDGRIEREVRTFGTTTRELLELSDWLASEGCRHVALEATGVYWKPVWHILGEGDFELVLANARHVKNVPGRKSDVSDAAWQADLLAHGLIRASFVPDGATQELRGLLGTRKQLVGAGRGGAGAGAKGGGGGGPQPARGPPEAAGGRQQKAQLDHLRRVGPRGP